MSDMFSEKLKSYRTVNKLTVQQMADKIGIPKRTYEDWQASKHAPDKFKEHAILKMLDIE